MNDLYSFLKNVSQNSDFNAELSKRGGFVTFSNSGKRGGIKYFQIGLDNILQTLKDILEHLDVFCNLTKYKEKDWRDNGSTYFTDSVANANSTVQTKPLFSTLSKVIMWGNQPSLDDINPDEVIVLDESSLNNAISKLEVVARSFSPKSSEQGDDNKANSSQSLQLQGTTFSIGKLCQTILSTGLIYSPTLIKRLAFSLMAKPFVILSGLAGSGKTQLALAFAKCLSESIEEQVCTVSIGADWTNREQLLGYPNALKSGEYVKPESGVLQLLMRANDNPSKPYFLILDEMNLSVVERYFADFLSAMESGEPIKLWDGNESEEDENKYVPAKIHLPKNVFIIGTINVDETTYMFSPKVLDRANVIEFKIAADEMEDYLGKKVNINLEQAYSACADMAVDFVTKAKSQVEKDEKNKAVLLLFFKELKEVNAEFGYRTVNEISRYLHFADGDLDDNAAIDTAILQKLLPKLHGSAKKLKKVLESMWKHCLNKDVAKEIDAEFNKDDFKYPESAEKIRRMYKAVVDNGFTSFAEA